MIKKILLLILLLAPGILFAESSYSDKIQESINSSLQSLSEALGGVNVNAPNVNVEVPEIKVSVAPESIEAPISEESIYDVSKEVFTELKVKVKEKVMGFFTRLWDRMFK